jgi:hypothetical protein
VRLVPSPDATESTPQTETRPLAFQYNGLFTPAFLQDDEEVRAGTDGSAVVRARGSGLSTPETVLAEVRPGQWLARLDPWGPPVVIDADVADAIRTHVPEFPERADA